MHEIERRLQELDKERFESLIHQLLVSKYPEMGIKKVEGAGGDEGIDSFAGHLDQGPAIWQCKHFTGRIGGPQKKQIVDSIQTAFKNRNPSRWTLCLSRNLRSKEFAWFQTTIVDVFGGPERIGLMQASDLLEELIHNRPLRDAFFPTNVLSDVLRLRELSTKTEGITTAERGLLAVEYAQQYLEAITQSDPRLRAVVNIGGPPSLRLPPQQHGLVMSLTEGEKSTFFFARNVHAFNLDPIRFSIATKPEHAKRLEKALDLGIPFKLAAGQVLTINSSSKILQSFYGGKDSAQFELELRPSLPPELKEKTLPLRLMTGSHRTREFPCIFFRAFRLGRREIAFESEGHLPVKIALRFRLGDDMNAGMTFRPVIQGAKARDAQRVLEFLDELKNSGQIEVSSVETGEVLFRSADRFTDDLAIGSELRNIVADAAVVSAFFGVDLRIPEKVYNNETENLVTLKRIATGESFFGVTIRSWLTKDLALQDRVVKVINGEPQIVRLENPNGWETFKIFDQEIASGPVTFIAENATMLSPEETLKAYLMAPNGGAVPWNMRCDGPCRFIPGINKSTIDPRAAFSRNGTP